MTMSLSIHVTPRTMRAAVFERFGTPEVVRLAAIAVPQPGPHDIRIRVAASTVSAADRRMRARDLPRGLGLLALPVVGLFRPRRRVLGMDFAGTVETVGAAVTRFKPGDEVVGVTGSAFGGHAEFVVLPETAAIAMKPEDLSHEDAVALVFGGHTMSECIRRCAIHPGDEVLVNGAAGAVGSAGVIAFALFQGAGALQVADLALVAAVASAAIGYAWSGQIARTMPGGQVIAWALVIALPVTVPLTLLGAVTEPQNWTPRATLGFAYVALVSQFLAFFAWNRGLALGGVARVSQTQLLQPFVTIAAAAILLGEPLSLLSLSFAVLVVGAVAVGRRMKVERPPA